MRSTLFSSVAEWSALDGETGGIGRSGGKVTAENLQSRQSLPSFGARSGRVAKPTRAATRQQLGTIYKSNCDFLLDVAICSD